jgi:hypothetical protein
VAFIPSPGPYESCQEGVFGHYWGATVDWAFDKKRHPSTIVERILYAFGASTAQTSGSARQLVFKATNRDSRSFLRDFIPAAAAEKDSSSNFVDLTSLPEGEVPAPPTALQKNNNVTKNNNVKMQEGSTPPKELAARMAAASAATTTTAKAPDATAATNNAAALGATAPTDPDANAATGTDAAPGTTAQTAEKATTPKTPSRASSRARGQPSLFP